MRLDGRRFCRLVFPLFLILFLAARTDAQELSDLHLRKMKASFAEPNRKGMPRSKLTIQGRISSHQVPRDFMFHPERTPLSLVVGGVPVLAASGAGEWKQTGSYTWTYREKSPRKVKFSIEFGRGEFKFRGRRLDLDGMHGPLDCSVFLFFGDLVFGTSADGQAKGSGWKWVPAGGGIPSKVPGHTPPPPDGPDPEPDGTPEPVEYKVLVDGNTLQNQPPGQPWRSPYVVRDQSTWVREWTTLFPGAQPPAVNFGTHQVLLIHTRGNYFEVFKVEKQGSRLIVSFRTIPVPGPRSYVYRAIRVPIATGGVTFQVI